MDARIGAHLNGGVKGALTHARRIGLGSHDSQDGTGGPVQLWAQSPAMWRSAAYSQRDVACFREGCAALDLWPIFIHGIYLMNFASPDGALWERSIGSLVDHLAIGAQLGAQAVIVHPGSGGVQEAAAALDRCALAIRRALTQTAQLRDRPLVALETCAGAGQTLGRTFVELAGILQRLDNHSEVAVVLDTAHLWASGYDLASEGGLARTLKELALALPSERLLAVHANDSKVPLGSYRDRHENIGQGTIGAAAFARMLAQPVLRIVPWILEVPGYDGRGPDAENLRTLRRLASVANRQEQATAAADS